MNRPSGLRYTGMYVYAFPNTARTTPQLNRVSPFSHLNQVLSNQPQPNNDYTLQLRNMRMRALVEDFFVGGTLPVPRPRHSARNWSRESSSSSTRKGQSEKYPDFWHEPAEELNLFSQRQCLENVAYLMKMYVDIK